MDGRNELRVPKKNLFRSRSIRDRNTSIGAKGLWEWSSEPIKIFTWHSRFRDGRELLEDGERGGRPKSTRTEVNIAAVGGLIKKKRPLNRIKNDSRIFEHSQDCSSSDSERGFRKKKVVCTFCSTLLDTWAREDRVTSCQDIIAMADADKNVFNKIITGDETWCSAYDPKAKRQSSEWVGETFPRPKKLKFHRSRVKTMLIIFSTLKT